MVLIGQINNNALAYTGAQNVANQGTAFKLLTSDPTFITTSTSGNGVAATINFSGGLNLGVGTTVVISGVRPNTYNGTWIVTSSSAGSISFASTAVGSQTTAGSIQDISISPTWGANDVCVDQTGENNPVAGCIGNEVDINIQSPNATTDNNRQRVGLQVSAVSSVSGTHVGRGILEMTDSKTVIDRGWEASGSFVVGFDSTGGTFSVSPIFLASGQKIVLDGNTNGTYSRYLQFSNGVLYYVTPSGSVSITDAGILSAKGFTANAATGVTCSGTPSSNFASVNGIVTHC